MIYLLLCSLIWAFSYGLIKTRLVGLDQELIAGLRMLLAALIFLPWVKSLPWKKVLLLMFVGFVQYSLMYYCFLRSFQYLQAAEIAVFTAFTPLYVLLLGREAKRWSLLAVLLAIVAGVLLSYKSSIGKWQGVVLVQLADLTFALGQVLYRELRLNSLRQYQDQRLYAWVFLGGFLGSAALALLGGKYHNWMLPSTAQLVTIVYLGIVASGIAFFSWSYASVRVSLGTLAVANNMKAPLAVVVSVLVFGESIVWWRICATLLLLLLAFKLVAKPHK